MTDRIAPRRGPLAALFLALLLAAAVGISAPAAAQPPDRPAVDRDHAPEGDTGRREGEATGAVARRFMAVTANRHATRAAVEVLREGGSAVDAAIAAQFVLALVEPQSSGIGGGGFLLHWDAAAERLTSYDGRETAPMAADGDLFLGPDGTPLGFFDAVRSGRSVGTPGLVALLHHVHGKHGKLPWKRLVEPAVALAEDGFSVSPRLHGLIAATASLRRYRETRRYFHLGGRLPLPIGYRLRNREFATTLRRIAAEGPDAFYRGEIAADIAAAVRDHPERPGVLAPDDLARYRVIEREPVCAVYREHRICGMGPPSSGGLAVGQMLGFLERFDMASLSPDGVDAAHLLAEAGRFAFADRDRYVADPAFVAVPARGMLEPRYLRARSALIDPERAAANGGAVLPGIPPDQDGAVPPEGESYPGGGTTHLSIVDGRGNVVALTSSIEMGFGSQIMVRGFLLNNQLTDFSFRAERDGRPVANRVEPGKRPRSSMSPTMVFDGDGRLRFVTGSPGGPRIIGYVAANLVALLDWDLSPQAAAARPHVVNRNGVTELEVATGAMFLSGPLRRRGHKVSVRVMNSGLHVIDRRADGSLSGGVDPRREGTALGE